MIDEFSMYLIYSELVLSLYYKENKELTGGGNKKLTGGIHGYWYCNILDGRVMVTLKNNDPVSEQLTEQIEDLVQADFKAMRQGDAMLWRPRGKRASTPKHLTHQTKLHNVYRGEIFRADCIRKLFRTRVPQVLLA